MGKFNERLESALKQDKRFVSDEGDLLKNEIITAAYKVDDNLISMLLSDDTFKDKFFKKIKGSHVFDILLFVDYVQDKNFLIDSYTKFKNKIGLTIDGKSLRERGEVALVWPFKDCILEGGMDNEKTERKEIFFNEILAEDEITRLYAPKILTNGKKYNARGEKPFDEFSRDKNGTIKDNLIIKGNNLLAMHSLYREFVGKVKLIYMDPPYNTGSDGDSFKYNNNFKHSTWLTFIRNRLEISKKLLREDGFIAITIDHVELFYLGTLADEVFGRENRIGLITIEHNRKGKNQTKFVSHNSEFMIIYARNKDIAEFRKVTLCPEKTGEFDKTDESGKKYRLDPFIRQTWPALRENKPDNFYPIYVSPDLEELTTTPKKDYQKILPIISNGKEYTWKVIKKTFEEELKNKKYEAERDDNGGIVIYNRYYEQQIFKNIWTDKRYNAESHGTHLIKKMIGPDKFSYPKSLYAVIDTLKMMTSKNDIILDFHAGSGTTAHATLYLNEEDGDNRQFILVEQMNYIDDTTKARIQKVVEGNKNGEFVYFELKEYNQEFINRIQSAKNSKELLQIWEDMKVRSFINFGVNLGKEKLAFEEWKKMEFQKQQICLMELLDKNHLYVNYSEIDDDYLACTAEEKSLTQAFYKSDSHD